MWEKLVWTMAREMLFPQRLAISDLATLVEFSRPLSLSDYKDQPHWVQQAYVEIKVKLYLIQSLGFIELHNSKVAGQIGKMLKKRFVRDFVKSVGSQIDRLNPNAWITRTHLRRVTGELWSKLLTVLRDIAVTPRVTVWNMPPVSLNAILSTFTILDAVPRQTDCEGLEREFANALDIAFCSLVLFGLLASVVQDPKDGLAPIPAS